MIIKIVPLILLGILIYKLFEATFNAGYQKGLKERKKGVTK